MIGARVEEIPALSPDPLGGLLPACRQVPSGLSDLFPGRPGSPGSARFTWVWEGGRKALRCLSG